MRYADCILRDLDSEWVPSEDLKLADVVAEESNQSNMLRYVPHFVPQSAIMTSNPEGRKLKKLATCMFNSAPGEGLAFLCATGSVVDYPKAQAKFLNSAKVDHVKVGEFLGEPYPKCDAIRLETFNAHCKFVNTGIISAMVQACRVVPLPSDLHKVDRLIFAISSVWWRHHERLEELADGEELSVQKAEGYSEICGLELKGYFSSPETLHQLMLSTLLLCSWSKGSVQSTPLDFEKWVGFVGAIGDHTPAVIFRSIWDTVWKSNLPELVIPSLDKARPTDCSAKQQVVRPWPAAAQTCVEMKGWADVESEPPGVLLALEADANNSAVGNRRMWLDVACGLLFLSRAHDAKAPFAVMELRGLDVTEFQAGQVRLKRGRRDGSEVPSLVAAALQSDGCFKELALTQLEIMLTVDEGNDKWLSALRQQTGPYWQDDVHF
eukprot:TRINITY_DN64907_c0_g1_i1.p1 TRINITY_DN64907_c0_g1~~TRINITY_DN64907_c0_g1_i1.p1  ORF type:complete len:436 (+),score=68.16 TRINITY_DN64907_c0_g1_i1:3-1310(+)